VRGAKLESLDVVARIDWFRLARCDRFFLEKQEPLVSNNSCRLGVRVTQLASDPSWLNQCKTRVSTVALFERSSSIAR
jgi:hypothetical protein